MKVFCRSLLIIFSTALLSACGRSDLIRLRILTPVVETEKDHSILTDTKESSSSSYTNTSNGGSLYFLLKSIGLGYSTVTTKFEKTGTNLKETTTLKTNFYDLAFSLGENYSFMWGAGVLSGLEHERYLEYTDEGKDQLWVKSDPVGHSLFFMLGHHGFGFETLVGYRVNFIKTEFYDSNIPSHMGKYPATGKDVSYKDTKINLTTSQVQLGIGITF
ncbi:MAG: hypothetical protein CL935_04695 [Deltaproteobacteria bacterium]|nr:hypothetical protein [Deltaproteobacteria bacterium]